MARRTYFVKALWDSEAKVYYSDSNIEGLHIEAETLDEFEAVIMEAAIELIVENHLSATDLAEKSIKELVPAIVWQRPAAMEAA